MPTLLLALLASIRFPALRGGLRSLDSDWLTRLSTSVVIGQFNFNSSDVGIFFLELNSKSLYRSSKKEIESRCLVLTVSTKRQIRHFHVEVV